MKISELIKELTDIMEHVGDIECIYSTDDEGNGYSYIHYMPTLMQMNEDHDAYSTPNIQEMMEDEDFCIDDYKPVCCVN